MEDSISRGESKLIRDKDGYPVFPNTTADLKYVNKAIKKEEADITSSATFMNAMKTNPALAFKIIDQQLSPEKYVYTGKRVELKK